MKIPEIERDLKGKIDPKAIYHLMRMQEEIIALSQQLDECAKILVMLVQTLENVQKVNLDLNARWENRLQRDGGHTDMVQSVVPEPED